MTCWSTGLSARRRAGSWLNGEPVQKCTYSWLGAVEIVELCLQILQYGNHNLFNGNLNLFTEPSLTKPLRCKNAMSLRCSKEIFASWMGLSSLVGIKEFSITKNKIKSYTAAWQLAEEAKVYPPPSKLASQDSPIVWFRNGMLFVETSAKTAANCALVFESVAKNISGYVEPPTNESAGAPPTKHPEPGEDPDTATPISTPPTFTPPTSTTPGPGSK